MSVSITGGGGAGFAFALKNYDPADYSANGTWTVAAFSATNYISIGMFGNMRLVYVNLINTVYAGPGSGALEILNFPFVVSQIARVPAVAFVGGVSGQIYMEFPTIGGSRLRLLQYGGTPWGANTITVSGQIGVFV